jgi:hypothetical protein
MKAHEKLYYPKWLLGQCVALLKKKHHSILANFKTAFLKSLQVHIMNWPRLQNLPLFWLLILAT